MTENVSRVNCPAVGQVPGTSDQDCQLQGWLCQTGQCFLINTFTQAYTLLYNIVDLIVLTHEPCFVEGPGEMPVRPLAGATISLLGPVFHKRASSVE